MNGYMENAQGHMIPVEQVKEIDITRHELVMEKVAKVKALAKALADLKSELMDDIGAFVDLSTERYGVSRGGVKGNVTLTSFDGRFRLVRQMAEYIMFDERLTAAKALIDECLTDWTSGSRTELRALVNQAFQVDSTGRINTGRILSLRRLEITDPRWQRAMQAIGDSIQITGTKPYVRLYERSENGAFAAIPLDIAVI